MPQKNGRPTQRTIAKLAGVTSMTVSLALRNHTSIPPATCARIQKLASVHGYVPDPTVAKLMHHLRTGRLKRVQSAICGLTNLDVGPRDHYVWSITSSAKQRAAQLGFAYDVLEFASFLDNPLRLRRVLRNRGVEGILLLPMKNNVAINELLEWSEFAVVAATHAILEPRFHKVVPDQFSNMLLACQQLAATGCRRIGLFTSRWMDSRTRHGFTAALAWHNNYSTTEPVDICLKETGAWEREEIVRWFAREKPDAILVDSTESLAAVTTSLKPRQRDKMQIVNVCPTDKNDTAYVTQEPATIGATSIDILSGMLLRGEKGIPTAPTVTMVSGNWVDRKIGTMAVPAA